MSPEDNAEARWAVGEEWAERVARWRRSGLGAQAFAESIGVKPATLRYSASRRGGWARSGGGASQAPSTFGTPSRPQFIELIAEAVEDRRFELEFGSGRRLRTPPDFEAAALEDVLRVVGRARAPIPPSGRSRQSLRKYCLFSSRNRR